MLCIDCRTEYKIRLGVTKADLQAVSNRWRSDELSKELGIAEVELIKACWSEALDFHSDREFELRTGWAKQDALLLFQGFMKDRREWTIRRQWE
jgi:hypothetical protein